ncbi:class I SAM-dependent methyltransferase [Methylobacterium nigriterrae]|uniref:class I SAM-dependent methyltransferase n=1 Tax=Methylobacterium nigriterrae TaxID=3127512 RepID=UPI0030139B27
MSDLNTPRANSSRQKALISALAWRDKILKSLASNGLGGTIRVALLKLINDWRKHRWRRAGEIFDRSHNINTEEIIPVSELAAGSSDTNQSLWYEPAPVDALQVALRRIRNDYSRHVFIDLGSGMGRCALIASDFNFRKIIGVEFAENLHSQAIKNRESYHSKQQKCADVDFLLADVRSFNFPCHDLVVCIFDAFKSELLKEVLSNLRNAYYSSGKSIHLIYVNPTVRNRSIELMESSGFLRKRNPFNLLDKAKLYFACPLPVVVYEAVEQRTRV